MYIYLAPSVVSSAATSVSFMAPSVVSSAANSLYIVAPSVVSSAATSVSFMAPSVVSSAATSVSFMAPSLVSSAATCLFYGISSALFSSNQSSFCSSFSCLFFSIPNLYHSFRLRFEATKAGITCTITCKYLYFCRNINAVTALIFHLSRSANLLLYCVNWFNLHYFLFSLNVHTVEAH